MSGHISVWRWTEHILAVVGLAWFANSLIEAMAGLVGRQRQLSQAEREVRALLSQIWEGQPDHSQNPPSPEEPPKETPSPEDLTSSELEKLKNELSLARWAGALAWRRIQEGGFREALAEVYTRAWKALARQGKVVAPEQLRRISESVARGQPRPSDATEAFLYDLTDLYLQARRNHITALRAATLVPMMLEEYEKFPEGKKQELLLRWEIRIARELNSYRPKEE